MNDPRVVIYGAGGHTGRLVAGKLAARGIPFLAAGRDKARIEQRLTRMPELVGARYECVQVPHTTDDLALLFEGRTLVYNTAGPFMQLAAPVVDACLRVGCHYLDSTAEQDWMLHARRTWADRFAARDLLLGTAYAMMWTSGHLAAEICLETPGIDELDIVYAPRGVPSAGSARSFVRMTCQPQHMLFDRGLRPWPPDTVHQVTVPGIHTVLTAMPWGGGGEPVWYLDDPRVAHCQVLASFGDPQAMAWFRDRAAEFARNHGSRTAAEQESITNNWAATLTTTRPPPDRPEINRTVVSCHGRGDTGAVTAVLRGTCGYDQTGALAAIAAARILHGDLTATGFAPPAAAFGARTLLGDLAADGLVELAPR